MHLWACLKKIFVYSIKSTEVNIDVWLKNETEYFANMESDICEEKGNFDILSTELCTQSKNTLQYNIPTNRVLNIPFLQYKFSESKKQRHTKSVSFKTKINYRWLDIDQNDMVYMC